MCYRCQTLQKQLRPRHQSQARASLVLSCRSCRRGVKSSIPLVNIRLLSTLHMKGAKPKRQKQKSLTSLHSSSFFQMRAKTTVAMKTTTTTNGTTDDEVLVCVDFELSSAVISVTGLFLCSTVTWCQTMWLCGRWNKKQILQHEGREKWNNTSLREVRNVLYTCLNISSVGFISVTNTVLLTTEVNGGSRWKISCFFTRFCF